MQSTRSASEQLPGANRALWDAPRDNGDNNNGNDDVSALLPPEIMCHVFSFLTCVERHLVLALVSRRWRFIALDERFLLRSCLAPSRIEAAKKEAQRPVRTMLGYSMSPCTLAAAAGHLDCLVCARSRGFRWSFNTSDAAAQGDHVTCLQHVAENGCTWWPQSIVSTATKYGSLECLIYAIKVGNAKPSFHDAASAAKRGHRNVLSYLVDGYAGMRHGRVCSGAAKGGRLDVLVWLRERGCRWDEWTCCSAAIKGHLHVLVYAHENGCPWDSLTTSFAASHGHLDCLVYARSNGCPVNQSVCKRVALREGHAHVVRYLQGAC